MSTVDKVYVLAFTVLCSLGVGYLLTHPSPRQDVLAMTHRVDTARQEAERARVIAIQAQYASKAAGQQERKAAAALGAQVTLVQDSLDTLRDVAQDSAASLDSVRQALKGSIQLADTLRIQVLIYMAAVDTLRERHAEERRAMTVALDRADSVLAHQDALIRALQKKAECRIFGRPCPSRTQMLLAGLGTGIVLGLAR